MRKIVTSLAVIAGLALVAGLGAAHPRAYVALGDVVSVCFTDGGSLQDVPSIGGTCFNAGHVVPSANLATVGISDNVQNPAGGFVCQDLDADVSCGGSANELSQLFCGSTTIVSTSGGGLWNPGAGLLWIFVNGPVNGVQDLAQGGWCGTFSSGTVGTVSHS